jgi:hypothetical protein
MSGPDVSAGVAADAAVAAVPRSATRCQNTWVSLVTESIYSARWNPSDQSKWLGEDLDQKIIWPSYHNDAAAAEI